MTSSLEYFPGIPIFHSRDLVNWTWLGHVLTRKVQLTFPHPENTKGKGCIYATVIRYHEGVFYVITTNVASQSNSLVKATNPEGPWSDPFHPKYPSTIANYWLLAEQPGWLTLHGLATMLREGDASTFIGQRQQHLTCQLRVLLDFLCTVDGEETGLTVFINEHFYT